MIIYKICGNDLWQEAKRIGVFTGMPIDHKDGYIHFSTAEQLDATAQKYFKDLPNLVLLSIETDKLEPELLKFEPARDGALFPHLYGPLPLDAVVKEAAFSA